MDKSWGGQTAQPIGGDLPVTVLLAFPVTDPRNSSWMQTLQMDARFRLAATANDPQDFQFKLASSPEVTIIEARLFPGPQPLAQALTAINGAVYLFLPQAANQETVEAFKQIPSVKQVIVGDAPMTDLLARAYGDALALRKSAPALGTQAWSGGQRSALVSGLRIVTIWNRVGGAGRTTLAAALSMAVARRSLKTLLVGLGSPDVLPLHVSLQPEPNVMSFFNAPSPEGFRSGLQKLTGGVDVMAGFPDISAEHTAMTISQQANSKSTLGELVSTATYDGYAAILLDTPTESFAPAAIMASNAWVMVARATSADAWASVEAYRAVTQRLAGQHRINPGNVVVVLNQRTNGQLTPDEWHKAADSACRKLGLQVGFPPVAAVLPFIPEVPLAQDAGRPVLDTSDEFARHVHKLADMLFGGMAGTKNGHTDAGVFKMGPLTIRSKR